MNNLSKIDTCTKWWAPGLLRGQTPVADLRYSINSSMNSVAAVVYATEVLGAKHVLLQPTFIPESETEPATCLFHPPNVEEYFFAAKLPWHEWFEEYVVKCELPSGDMPNEIFFVSGIDVFWMYFDSVAVPKNVRDVAYNMLVTAAEEEQCEAEIRIVYPDDEILEGVSGASPLGKAGLRFLDRPQRADVNYMLETNPGPVIPGTFSMDSHPESQFRVFSIP